MNTENHLQHIQARLAPNIMEALKAQAKATGVSLSQWVRACVTDALIAIEQKATASIEAESPFVEPVKPAKAQAKPKAAKPVDKPKRVRVRPSRSKAAIAERAAKAQENNS